MAYCKQHAEDGMVDIRSKHCSHPTCMAAPSFNVAACPTPFYCRQHAEDGMVIVRGMCCVHDSCTKHASWGVLDVGMATACSDHKGDIVDGPVINFKAPCKVTACKEVSTWGLSERQPSHCRYHGPLKDGLSQTIRGLSLIHI